MTNENETKDLVLLNKMTPEKLFLEEEGKEFVLEGVQNHIKDFVYDLSTPKGRTATNAMSRRIGGLQKSIDDLKKQTTAEWKEKAKKIDSGSKAIVDALEVLKNDFRKPLTELELFESECEERLVVIRGLVQRVYNSFDDLDVAKKQFEDASTFDFKDKKEVADNAFEIAQAHLLAVSDMLNRKQEAELAEKAAREQEELARIRREEAEKARLVAEKEAADKLEKEREAMREVERQRQAEAEKARLVAEKFEADLWEKQRAIAEKEAKEKAELAEKNRREADHEHRKTVNNQILNDFSTFGIDAETAKQLIVAIVGGKIPNLKIVY